MQVMCVAYMAFDNTQDEPIPTIGEECIVTGQGYGFGDRLFYQLSGYPVNIGYDACGFAILPEADADEMRDDEHEAIVPTPVTEETNELLKVERALRTYFHVYELTGCENRASAAYYESFDNPTS